MILNVFSLLRKCAMVQTLIVRLSVHPFKSNDFPLLILLRYEELQSSSKDPISSKVSQKILKWGSEIFNEFCWIFNAHVYSSKTITHITLNKNTDIPFCAGNATSGTPGYSPQNGQEIIKVLKNVSKPKPNPKKNQNLFFLDLDL